MTRHWDELSAVRSVDFDRVTHTLRIGFESGAVYDFADVPEHLYDELAHASAPDEFFHQNIRDDFDSTRIGEVDLADVADERREDAILGSALEDDDQADDTGGSPGMSRSGGPAGRRSEHMWIVDVVEEDSAAVEVDGRQITPVPRWLLPADARDGDVLRVTHDRSGTRSTLSIVVDRGATRLAFQRSAEQLRNMPPGDKGDVNLAD